MPTLYYFDEHVTKRKVRRRWFHSQRQIHDELGATFDQRMVEPVFIPKLTREAAAELLNSQPHPGGAAMTTNDGVPNIDAMDDDELEEAARAFLYLHRYCRNMTSAREYRQSGDIRNAQKMESLAESIYAMLPQAYRW